MTEPSHAHNGERQAITPRLLRTTDAARYLGMSDKAIRQLVMTGKLPHVQMKPGSDWGEGHLRLRKAHIITT
jgi:excisionase family DNA binding protein